MQRAVHPVAQVALIHDRIQLAHFAQAQHVERKEAIWASAQIVVAAGRNGVHRQAAGTRQRRGWGLLGHAAQGARVSRRGDRAQRSVGVQLPFQQQGAGQQFNRAIAGAGDDVQFGKREHVLPDMALCLLQLLLIGKTQQGALRAGPQARRGRRGRQALFVTAGHDDGGKGARQQLAGRHNGHLLLQGIVGHKAGCLQHLREPVHERFKRPGGSGTGRPRGRAGLPVQYLHQGLAGLVVLQSLPLAGGLQGLADIVQPLRQRAGALQGAAPCVDLQSQTCCRVLPVPPMGVARIVLRPLGAFLSAQMCLDGLHVGSRHAVGCLGGCVGMGRLCGAGQ